MSEPTYDDEAAAAFRAIIALPRPERLATYAKPKFLVPLGHPTIPPAGPDFVRVVADLLGVDKVPTKLPRDHPIMAGLDHIYRSALYFREWHLQVGFKGQIKSVEFLPGGFWSLPELFEYQNSSVGTQDHQWSGYRRVSGPRAPAPVMVVGKHPGVDEFDYEQNFIGQTSAPLHRALRELKVPREVRQSWYVTNTVKHNRLDPTSGTMQQSWLKDCAPLLWQEILLVRPRFIACLGTEAIKAVLGKGYTVTNMKGRVIDLTLRVPPEGADCHEAFEDLDSYVNHKIQVMGIPHPAYIARVAEAYVDLHGGLEQFVKLTGGDRPPDVENERRHQAYYVARPLANVIDDILERAHCEWDFEADGDLPIAWDAEWHGRQPGDAGAYLRTIQFAAAGHAVGAPVGAMYEEAPKKATCIVLTEKGGGEGWFRSREEVAGEINRLIEGRHRNEKIPKIPTRHGGHFFKADIPWIHRFLGVNFRPHWTAPPPLPAVVDEEDPDDPGYGVKRFDGVAYRLKMGERQSDADSSKAGQDRKRRNLPRLILPRDDIDLSEFRDKLHQPWELTRYHGGFDTGYMTHAVFEAVESFSLEHLAQRWTTCPRWDIILEQAKGRIAKELGIKVRDLSGYGDIPDDEIMPYALYDADATLRLFWRLNFARSLHDGDGFLDQDVYHNSSREASWRTMLAGLTFLEMEETGVTVDVDRGKELIKAFELVKERLTESLRADLDWPTFNPNSAPQTRALLFGEEYSGLIDKKTGARRDILPDHLTPAGLGKDPVKTTGKPSKAWAQLREPDLKSGIYTAAVDKEVLGIYSWGNAWEDKLIKKLRDIRYVRQVLQSVLRPPKPGEAIGADGGGAMVYDELDEFDGGFLSYVSPTDGRVRSRFYPVETGRCSSAGPNMQNLAKRREDDYARILGHLDENGEPEGDYLDILPGLLYHDPIRSIVTAGTWDGEPTVLMEFDIKSAEIAALAWEAGDMQMIQDVNRAMLPSKHPDFLDLHAATAVEAFKLDCAPTKKALKDLGRPGLRVAAKNVRFGVPYGRSAEALSRQCREEGAAVSAAECQRLIDNYMKRYPQAAAFLTDCENQPYNNTDKGRFIIGAYGRLRRFQPVDDKSVMAEQGRSAKNYPIQNLVADYILMLMYHLRRVRELRRLAHAFRMVLQIHDAVMLEVKIPYIGVVRDLVLEVVRTMVPIMPRTLAGLPFFDWKTGAKNGPLEHPGKPYWFDVDSSVFLNWGQDIDPERGRSLGIPEEYYGGE